MQDETCQCDYCKLSRRVHDAIDSRDPDKLIEILTEVMNHLCDVEFDRDYDHCILDGSWPSAVEQLEEALKNAKKKRDSIVV